MNRAISNKVGILSIFCIAIMTFAVYVPSTCSAADLSMDVDFSPKIINIASARLGEIRVFTNVRYSAFAAGGDSIYIYFNGGEDSVPNIRATRDSLGNLILRFDLDDLLAVEGYLVIDDLNNADVVVVMDNGDEYLGSDGEVYITGKQGR